MADTFLVQLDDELYRIPAECPHRGGRLKCGKINLQRGVITCPLHFSTFDLRTGRKLTGPDCADLVVVKVTA